MSQELHHITDQPTVLVTEDAIVLEGFIEHDPEVVGSVRETDDPEAAIHQLLGLGARTARFAGTTLDTAVVESAFARLTADFDQQLLAVSRSIEDATEGVVGEGGALPEALGAFGGELRSLIEATFDPNSRASAISKLDDVLAGTSERLVGAIRRLLDPTTEDAPLSRYRAELSREIRESSEATVRAVQELSERIAVRKAEADLVELTAGKGFTFEEFVHEALLRLVAPFADIAESVGTVAGACGGKVGDEVVTLCPDDTRGTEIRWVVECKDRRITSVKAVLDELEEAMANRQALAAVAVFSSQGSAPTAAPFQVFGDKAIVVFDKADPDDRALALAAAWARWVVRRLLSESPTSIDVDRIGAAIEDGRRALARVANVRRAHSIAVKKITEAGGQVDDLATDLLATFDAILSEIVEGEDTGMGTGCEMPIQKGVVPSKGH